MNYQDSLDYLYQLGHETVAIKLGLTNIKTLLAAFGEPQNSFLKIQVAGTNGKGSTCQFLNSICLAANLKVGLYTSPHLVSITERIKINNQEISENQFAELTTKVRETAQELVEAGKLATLPTFFEHSTVIALLAFQTARVEVAILETGLGGRLDATTAADAEIAALTPISLDHQEYLGNTLSEIAEEKAAIITSKTRAVVAAQQDPEAMLIIRKKCDSDNIELIRAARVIETQRIGFSPNISVSFKTENDVYEQVKLSLLGRHQLENAATAITLTEMLRKFDFKITKDDVRRGLETAAHAGRLEFAFFAESQILFDGAHNAAGAKALQAFLLEFYPSTALTIVFGAMRDKDLTEMTAELFPLAQHLILTAVNHPRSAMPEELRRFAAIKSDNVLLAQTSNDALKLAAKITGAGDLIVVTGSLYLIGEVKKILQSK